MQIDERPGASGSSALRVRLSCAEARPPPSDDDDAAMLAWIGRVAEVIANRAEGETADLARRVAAVARATRGESQVEWWVLDARCVRGGASPSEPADDQRPRPRGRGGARSRRLCFAASSRSLTHHQERIAD